jgi:hypothetical protein
MEGSGSGLFQGYHPGIDLEGLRRTEFPLTQNINAEEAQSSIFLVRLTLFCSSYFTLVRVRLPLYDSEPWERYFRTSVHSILLRKRILVLSDDRPRSVITCIFCTLLCICIKGILRSSTEQQIINRY